MENAVEDRYKNGVEHVLLLLKLNTPYESLLLVDISIWPKHFSKFPSFSDAMVRQVAMAFKCILLMYYKNGRGHSYRKQVTHVTNKILRALL